MSVMVPGLRGPHWVVVLTSAGENWDGDVGAHEDEKIKCFVKSY